MPGGAPSVVIDLQGKSAEDVEKLKKAKGHFWNDEKQTLFKAAEADAVFTERDIPEIKSFKGNVIRQAQKGKQRPAVILEEMTTKDKLGYEHTAARLSVFFGAKEGWKDTGAMLDNGHVHPSKNRYRRKEANSKE